MNLEGALRVEHKWREAKAEVERIETEATEAETALAAEGNELIPAAKARFESLGERIVALADAQEPAYSRGKYTGRIYTSFTELGVEGLGVALKARESYTPGSLRGSGLGYVEAKWTSTAYISDVPLTRERVDFMDVLPSFLTPEVQGMLGLIEQSVAVVELARKGEPLQ